MRGSSVGSSGQLAEAHPNWSTLACFSHFSFIQAQNYAPFFFVRFLTLQGIFYKNLRIFLNRLNLFAISLANSSGQLTEAYQIGALWSVLVISPSFELRIVHIFFLDFLLFKEHFVKI